LATSQEREDRYNEGIAHRNLGGAYQAYGDFKQSVQHHEQHLAIMLEISNQADFPAAHENLGRLYERLLDYRKVRGARVETVLDII
jgi:tetratricopeptide (TPR) repeat protein